MPVPAPVAAVERLEDPLAARPAGCPGRGRRPGPPADRRPRRARTSTGCRPSSAAAFSSRLASARSSWAASMSIERKVASIDRRRRSPRPLATSSAAARRSSSIDATPAAAAPCPPQPRQVEQLDRRAARAARLLADALRELLALLVAQARRAERRAGREDRRQRRAQVVRDGAQQRGLHLVAAGAAPLSRRPPPAGVAIERRRPAAPRAPARRARAGARALRRSIAGTSRVARRSSPTASGDRDVASDSPRPLAARWSGRRVQRLSEAVHRPSRGPRARSGRRAGRARGRPPGRLLAAPLRLLGPCASEVGDREAMRRRRRKRPSAT